MLVNFLEYEEGVEVRDQVFKWGMKTDRRSESSETSNL